MGAAQGGAAFARREASERAERQLVLNEQEGARAVQERTIALEKDNSNKNVRQLKNAGILNDGLDRIDRDRTVGKLEANDAVARAALLNVARTSGFIDPSVKDIRFVKANGAWVIQTSNEDGSFGVITLDGSSDPNSPVAQFKSLDDFIDIANIAYNDSVVRQDEFDIATQNTVTQQIHAAFDVLESQLEAQGVPPEEQVAIKRGVAAGVANIEDSQEQVAFINSVASGEPPAESETPAPENTMTPDEEPTQAPRPSRGPLAVMGEQEQRGLDARERLNNTRAERRRSQLPDEIAAAEADLAQVQADFEERGVKPRRQGANGELDHPAIQQRKDKITGLKAELVELEPGTFTMDTPEDQEAMDTVVDQTKELSPPEIAEKVASGEVSVTPAQQQRIATNLQEAGVETVADLAKLRSDRDRALAVAAMISVFKDNPNQQNALMQQISNVIETGTTSMSTKDATSYDIQQQNADTNLGRLLQTIDTQDFTNASTAAKIGSDLVTAFNKERDEDGVLDPQAVERFMPSLTKFFVEAAPLVGKDPRAAKFAMDALKPIASQILAVYAAEEEGGLSETWESLFRGDATGGTIDTTDFDLARVNGKFNSKGEIIGFTYTDPYGVTLDEMVEPRVLKDLNENVYRILELAVIAKNAPGQG